MTNRDRGEVLRSKARVLTYADIMEIVKEAVENDDGTSPHSIDGFSWNPECYVDERARINEAGGSLGRVLFADGGANQSAFENFLPAFNRRLKVLIAA
jgi:hypothetical protein